MKHWCHMDYCNNVFATCPGLGTFQFSLLSMEEQKALGFNQKYLNLCSEDERRSSGFGTT